MTYGIGGLFSGFADGYRKGVDIGLARDDNDRKNAEAAMRKKEFDNKEQDRNDLRAANETITGVMKELFGEAPATQTQPAAAPYQGEGSAMSPAPGLQQAAPAPVAPPMTQASPPAGMQGPVAAPKPSPVQRFKFQGVELARKLDSAFAEYYIKTKDPKSAREIIEQMRSRESKEALSDIIAATIALKENPEAAIPLVEKAYKSFNDGYSIVDGTLYTTQTKDGSILVGQRTNDKTGETSPFVVTSAELRAYQAKFVSNPEAYYEFMLKDRRAEAKEGREQRQFAVEQPVREAASKYELDKLGAKDGKADAKGEAEQKALGLGLTRSQIAENAAKAKYYSEGGRQSKAQSDALKDERVEKLRSEGIDKALGGAPDPNKATKSTVDLHVNRRAIASDILDLPENQDKDGNPTIKPETAGAVARSFLIEPSKMQSGKFTPPTDNIGLVRDDSGKIVDGLFQTRVGMKTVFFRLPPSYTELYSRAIAKDMQAQQGKRK